MKTKEIDVWVPDFIDKEGLGLEDILPDTGVYSNVCGPVLEEDGVIYYRAKLIVEIPEKKIEITESEFDRICRKIFNEKHKCRSCDHFFQRGNCDGCNYDEYDKFMEVHNLKELFGDD